MEPATVSFYANYVAMSHSEVCINNLFYHCHSQLKPPSKERRGGVMNMVHPHTLG